MTDTITVGSITQSVQPAGRVSWFPPMERNEFTFVVQPDPRDAFIAEQEARYFKLEQELNDAFARIRQLEAALSSVRDDLSSWRISFPSHQATMRTIDDALMPEPEASMRETVEELEA